MRKIKVLLSIYNISGYLISELTALSRYADIVVIETPCKRIGKGNVPVRWIDRTTIKDADEIMALLDDFKPDVFVCGGWTDRVMLKLATTLRRAGATTVLGIDTPWKGTIRQFIHCLYSRIDLVPRFCYAWGAGVSQAKHLCRLGFKKSYIKTGSYCADTEKFSPIGRFRKTWPHVFLYIGRYVAVKNMSLMQSAFLKALDRMQAEGAVCDWKLRCIGGGELWDQRVMHPQIEHLGYKTPDEIQDYVEGAGCFVLPSIYEPWGVVVHEAALMGLPMLCSSAIQAATAYLSPGKNGFLFDPHSEESMVEAYLKIMRSSEEALAGMGKFSFRLGMSYTSDDWARTLIGFYEDEDHSDRFKENIS